MSDYDKKVNPKEPDPYENLSVNPIEKDKKQKEEFEKMWREPPRPQFFAALISFFKKMISPFSSKSGENFFLFEQEGLFEHLTAFRSALYLLTQQDESHNAEFTENLSQLWHELIEDCNAASGSQFPKRTLEEIKSFMEQMAHYPVGADHTLGFYFDAYAGKDWIPFPFMDMLKDLHEECRVDPTSSHLLQWLSLLDNILQ